MLSDKTFRGKEESKRYVQVMPLIEMMPKYLALKSRWFVPCLNIKLIRQVIWYFETFFDYEIKSKYKPIWILFHAAALSLQIDELARWYRWVGKSIVDGHCNAILSTDENIRCYFDFKWKVATFMWTDHFII